jgi:hypothetical protein
VSFRLGGCDFAEDPTQDAREVHPVWPPDSPSVVRIIRDHEARNAARFSVWSLPGRKVILHDGTQLRLGCSDFSGTWRLSWPSDLADGDPLGFVMTSGPDLRAQWSAISDFTQILKADFSVTQHARLCYPSRLSIVHMRTLQALDGYFVGASQREIGAALFGDDAVGQRWLADGELRAQVRYLIRRGRALLSGGYRCLLHLSLDGKGDSDPPSKSP